VTIEEEYRQNDDEIKADGIKLNNNAKKDLNAGVKGALILRCYSQIKKSGKRYKDSANAHDTVNTAISM